MAGRQAHGRAPTAKPLGKRKLKQQSKGASRARALNAYNIAADELPNTERKTPRNRALNLDYSALKHGRDISDGEEGGEEGPRRKKAKSASRGGDEESDGEYGSDEEGNRWKMGGLLEDDEDSEIDSDDAFGESDEEKFQDFTFGGSTKKGDDSDAESDDESLGEDAIDLAQALDLAEQESDEDDGESGSDSDSDDETDASASGTEDSDDDSEYDAPQTADALKSLVAEFAGVDSDDDANKPAKAKINLEDLGLAGVRDPHMKKSLKLMAKEEKETRPGATKKLDVPLARRQQDRVLRKAAYEKTTETLDRWTETIKRNRRADHLVFPLPQELPNAGLTNDEMQPLKKTTATSELEQTMFSLLEQSGLSLEKEKKKKQEAEPTDEEYKQLSKQAQKELLEERRMKRELQSREAKRLARLKKIKSKAYHRIHRREKQKEEMAAREAMAEAGEINSEDEREAQDRARALERVGARHKNSRWAKTGSKVKRAVWDDDFRTGLVDMARRDEELRKRIEGRGDGESDDDDVSSDEGSESEDDRARLQRQLERAAEVDESAPQSKLMQLKFMRREEERMKQANDELVEQIRRDLDSDADSGDDEDDDKEVGRRKYGMGTASTAEGVLIAADKKKAPKKKTAKEDGAAEEQDDDVQIDVGAGVPGRRYITEPDSIGGAWSKDVPRRKSKKGTTAPSHSEPLDLNASIMIADAAPKSKKSSKTKRVPAEEVEMLDGAGDHDSDADSDEGIDLHLPLAIRDRDLIARAFAGDDVVAQFEQEKEELAEEQDDKVVDNTLPGWGSWAGDGVSAREKNRHRGRFVTKIEGVKRQDRQDAKLKRVIINEKKVKKNEKYLATQLPHEFESKDQYEGTLRLPVGADWVTKESFQEGTKPRVIIKQGIIAPMSKPII